MSEQGETGEAGEQGLTGDRGPTGDTGQTGATGLAGAIGRPGLVGITGVSGERGPTGDHGQHGDPGEIGETGDRGQKGDKGDRGRGLTIWQTLTLFLIVVVAFAAVSYRAEMQQRQINSNTQKIIAANYQGCLGGIAILARYNQQMVDLAQIEIDYPLGTPGRQKARIKAYQEGEVVPLPQCEKPR